jgi:hypothetical protein
VIGFRRIACACAGEGEVEAVRQIVAEQNGAEALMEARSLIDLVVGRRKNVLRNFGRANGCWGMGGGSLTGKD